MLELWFKEYVDGAASGAPSRAARALPIYTAAPFKSTAATLGEGPDARTRTPSASDAGEAA